MGGALLLFPFSLSSHRLPIAKVVEILYGGERFILEALWIYSPAHPEYDALRRELDRNRDGTISPEELRTFAEKEARKAYFFMRVTLDGRDLPLRLERSTLREYPEKTLDSKEIVIWARFSARAEPSCPEIGFRDSSSFDPVALRIRTEDPCSLPPGMKRTYLLQGKDRRVVIPLVFRKGKETSSQTSSPPKNPAEPKGQKERSDRMKSSSLSGKEEEPWQ
jgi:hypothetical protein